MIDRVPVNFTVMTAIASRVSMRVKPDRDCSFIEVRSKFFWERIPDYWVRESILESVP